MTGRNANHREQTISIELVSNGALLHWLITFLTIGVPITTIHLLLQLKPKLSASRGPHRKRKDVMQMTW